MKTLFTAIFVMTMLTGCNPNQHVWDEIESCKNRFKEDCTLIAVPVSKGNKLMKIISTYEK